MADNRASSFKNRGHNSEELRARRIEVNVELRKEKRDLNLVKRRHIGNSVTDSDSSDGIAGDPAGVVWLMIYL